jgi:hypothetical protein
MSRTRWEKAAKRLRQARLEIVQAGLDGEDEKELARARAAYSDLLKTCRRHGLTGERRAA